MYHKIEKIQPVFSLCFSAYSAPMILICSTVKFVSLMTISVILAVSLSPSPAYGAETTTLMLSSPINATQSVYTFAITRFSICASVTVSSAMV